MSSQIYAVIGSDEGMIAEKSLALFNKIKPESDDEFINDVIDGTADNADLAFQICSEVIQGLQTLSFFGDEKVVWLKGANFLGSDRVSESERAKAGVAAIIDVLEAGLGEGVTFLLSASAMHKGRAMYKFINEYGKIQVFDKIDISDGGQQLAHFIKLESKKRNLEFSPDALLIFTQLVGVDSMQINSELEKLDLYLGEQRRTVELADVEVMVPLTREGIVFEIGRALQNKNGTRAIRLIDEQLESGENAIGMIRASLIPTIRNLFMAKLVETTYSPPTGNFNSFKAVLNKYPEKDLAWLPKNKSGALSLYPLFLSAVDSKKFSIEVLKKAMFTAHDIDRKLVTTSIDHRVLLHKLIVELCA